TNCPKSPIVISPADGEQGALGISGLLGNDVDHPVHRIGPPQRSAGPANDFNALDVFEHRVLHIPKHVGIGGVVDTAAIDEDQKFVAADGVCATNANRPIGVVDLCHFHSWDKSQDVGDIGGARTPNV